MCFLVYFELIVFWFYFDFFVFFENILRGWLILEIFVFEDNVFGFLLIFGREFINNFVFFCIKGKL